MNPLYRIILAAALIGMATPAIACDLLAGAEDTALYAPDSLTRQAVTLRLSVRGDAADCVGSEVSLAPLTDGTSLEGPGGSLPLVHSADPLIDRSATTLRLTPTALTLLTTRGEVSIPLGTLARERFVAPGIYRGTYRLMIDEVTVSDAEAVVEVIAAARLAPDQNAIISLDFGEAVAGGTVSSDFFYQSNSTLSLSVQSDNGGELIHSDDPSLSPLPYEAQIDSRPVPLDGNGSIFLTPRSGASSGSVRVHFTIPQVPPAYAGRYHDRVTIKLTAY